MKNVLLLGDSIRRGYDEAVKLSLENIANVYFPEDNSRFASYLLRYLHGYYHGFFGDFKGEEIDVIHWNAGLWDCLRILGEEPFTPLDVYAYYIERICKRITTLCPNAKVIFATSTSVISEKMEPEFKRYNEEIEQYNQTAIEIVKRYGFQVNDLYTMSQSLPAEAHSDAVHYYTPMGTEAFTKQVLSYLLPALEGPDSVRYREKMYTDEPVGI